MKPLRIMRKGKMYEFPGEIKQKAHKWWDSLSMNEQDYYRKKHPNLKHHDISLIYKMPSAIPELYIYFVMKEIKEDQIKGGKGDGMSGEKFASKELKVGIAVEMEHTDDPAAAKEIAIDHLAEDPEYYTKLVNSGIVDEPEALKLAKKFGMMGENKMTQEQKIRAMIREMLYEADTK